MKKIKLNIKDQFDLNNFGSTREVTKEGYLKGVAAITTVGVQYYSAREFDIDSDDLVGVFRPPETVFHPDTMETSKQKPITMTHPDQDVDANNHGRLSIGSTGEQAGPIDDNRLGVNIIINDSSIVDGITSQEIGELSLGYDSFIIPEGGQYNGESYVYRFDGPMIINHLAVLQKGDGRCGESVKILDHGDDNMKKSKAVQLLKDAGCPDDKLALFMKDAKDDADADMKEFTQLLGEVSAKDMDLSGVIPMVAKELKPVIEKMIKGKEFLGMLAKEVASSMSGGGEPEMEDQDPMPEGEEDPEPEMEDACNYKKDSKEDLDKKIRDAAAKRSSLISQAQPFLAKDSKVDEMSNREIIEAALKAVGMEDCKDKSDDYLKGMLDSITSDRAKAEELFKSKDSEPITSIGRPISGLDAKNLEEVK